MLKFNLLSKNLYTILITLLENNNLQKYLYYNETNPLSQPNLDDYGLLFNRIFPYPFVPGIQETNPCYLNVYYPSGNLKDKVIEDTRLYFDILIPKEEELWLVNDGESLIRPYEIMSSVIEQFDEKSIGTVGILRFTGFNYIPINEKYDAIRLIAKMFTLSG